MIYVLPLFVLINPFIDITETSTLFPVYNMLEEFENHFKIK